MNAPYNALETALANAIAHPQTVEFETLWELLLEVLAPLPPWQQFEVAGDVILKMADILVERAQLLLCDREPEAAELVAQRLTRELIEPFTRTMHLNVTGWIKPKPPRKPRKRAIAPTDSVIGEVDKKTLLAVVEAETAHQAFNVSHEEAIAQWATQLQECVGQEVLSLVELRHRSQMPLVQVWMTVLLDGRFQVQQTGEFYQTDAVIVRAV